MVLVRRAGPFDRLRSAFALGAAAVAFLVYAVVGGLVPMAAPFPPASIVNGEVVLDTLGVPIEVFRSITGPTTKGPIPTASSLSLTDAPGTAMA